MSYRGKPCKPGYDSHISANEWVIFSAAQVGSPMAQDTLDW